MNKKRDECMICGKKECDISNEIHTRFRDEDLYLCQPCRYKIYKFIEKVYNVKSLQYTSSVVGDIAKQIKQDPCFLFLFW